MAKEEENRRPMKVNWKPLEHTETAQGERFDEDLNELHYKDLQAYYSQVLQCKLCGKYYGLDYDDEYINSNVCPICGEKVNGRRSRFSVGKKGVTK